MRKTAKSALGEILLNGVPTISTVPSNASFVIDGGYLLRKSVWHTNSNRYIDYILGNLGHRSSVIFDGYESELSTKEAKQARRETKGSSGEIYFDHNMIPSVTQRSFLLNKSNKSRFKYVAGGMHKKGN